MDGILVPDREQPLRQTNSIVLFVTLILSACSPYPYSSQAEGLAAAGASLQAGYQTNQELVLVDTNQADKLSWLGIRPQLVLSNCAPTDNRACTVVDKAAESVRASSTPSNDPEATTKASTFDACELVDAKSVELAKVTTKGELEARPLRTREDTFRSLSSYLTGLQAVTNAKDRSDFDASAGKLSTAVGAVIGTAAAIAGVPGGALAGPVGKAGNNVVLWAIGTELDNRRYQTLRAAVVQACQPVRILSAAVGVFLEEQQGIRVGQQYRSIIAQINITNRSRHAIDAVYGANLDYLLKLVTDFNAVRGLNVSKLSGAFSEAHDKLVVAVWSDDGQFDAVYKALGELNAQLEPVIKSAKAVQSVR